MCSSLETGTSVILAAYLELPFGHWSSQPEFWEAIVPAADEWFKKHSEMKEAAQMLDAASPEPT
jgi:hypothetical protein